MSQQNFTNYINSWIGKTYDGDNFPRGFEIQCTDWPPKFIMDFGGLESPFGMRISGGAKDWFEDFGRSGARPQWGPIKIANTPSGFPMAGDIVVWGSNLGAGYGHVAVSDFNDNPNVVNVIEQNGIGGGKGRGGDAIRRFKRPQAPIGWIRIPAIYNKIFTSNSNNNDMAIAQNILNKLKSNNFKITHNGQDWYGRLQGLIDNRELVIFVNELADVATWNQNAIEKTVSGLQTDLANRQSLGTTVAASGLQTDLANTNEVSIVTDAALETQKTEFKTDVATTDIIVTKGRVSSPIYEGHKNDLEVLDEQLPSIELTELIQEITTIKQIIVDIYSKATPEKANFKAWILGVIKGQNWYMNGFLTAALTALTTYLTTLQLNTTGLNAVVVGLIISVVTILKPKKV